jgi:hypothetical protein
MTNVGDTEEAKYNRMVVERTNTLCMVLITAQLK